jgi:hypothetical protein
MRSANWLSSVLVALALTTSLAACSAMSGRETAGEYVDDSTITAKVKAALFDDSSLKSMQIGVETMRDVVQSSGFVDSEPIKARAGEVARGVEGAVALVVGLVPPGLRLSRLECAAGAGFRRAHRKLYQARAHGHTTASASSNAATNGTARAPQSPREQIRVCSGQQL